MGQITWLGVPRTTGSYKYIKWKVQNCFNSMNDSSNLITERVNGTYSLPFWRLLGVNILYSYIAVK